MKKLLVPALCALLILTGCTAVTEPPVPTEVPSAATCAPTALPTQKPTEAPTDEPTAAPTLAPFPTPGRTGRLTDGPIFPEPAKYLVISGESDLHYVYNNMGELVRIFRGMNGEYTWGGDGLYGERGISRDTWVATGEPTGSFTLFMDNFITTDADWENFGGYSLCKVYNADFEELFDMKGSIHMGFAGGILDFGDRFLVLDRDMDWETGDMFYNSDPLWLSKKGERLGTLDPSPFGKIVGVFGEKYIMGRPSEGWDDDYYDAPVNLYDLSGRLVREGVTVCNNAKYSALDDEVQYGMLASASVIKYGGKCWDADFNEVGEPDYDHWQPLRPGDELTGVDRYRTIWFEDIEYAVTGVYAGVRTADGEWLFRIYRPDFASDHDNERWDW